MTGLVAVPYEAVGQEHGFEVKGLLEVPLTGVPGRHAVVVTVEVFPGETEPRPAFELVEETVRFSSSCILLIWQFFSSSRSISIRGPYDVTLIPN